VFEALLSDVSKTPQQLVDENDWTMVTDAAAIEEVCLRVLADNRETVCCCTYFCCYLKLVHRTIGNGWFCRRSQHY